MTEFVRQHADSGSSTPGTTVAATLAATVAAGNTLIATVHNGGGDGEGVGPTSLSKPVGETASWVKLIDRGVSNAAGDEDGRVGIWIMVTTVPWASGYSLVATWGLSVNYRGIALSEWAGLSAIMLDSDSAFLADSTNTAVTATLDPVLQAGDVTLQAALVLRATLTESNGGTATGTRYATVTNPNASSGAFFKVYGAGHIVTSSGSRSASYTPSTRAARAAVIVGLKAINYAPNAPTLSTMADGGTINRGITQRAAHVFSDPNLGDTQSQFDLRYRLVGAASWTTITQTTPNQFYDFAPGSLAAGSYERQVRTYDTVGAVGPWSTSGFFTAADAPSGPTITDPVNGSTIITASEPFTWSSPNQDSYQVRKVGDDGAGNPDTGTIYFNTGEVVDSAARTVQLAFPTNGRTEHLQVRVKYASLWSSWASIVVDVDYTEPPIPTLELSVDPGTGSLLVSITNPTPGGGGVPAVYNDVYVDDGTGEERRATAVSPNSSWRYWTPISGRDYSTAVRVVAVAASGATSSSV